MKKLITDFTAQIAKAVQIGNAYQASEPKRQFSNVLISGLGGSGIGGTIAAELTAGESCIPIITNNGYSVPAFIGKGTLFIACSYSGNTEETVGSTELAAAKGAKVAVISSGGKLTVMAKENGWDLISIPGGQPPRASFGLSFPQILFVLNAHGIISDGFKSECEKAIILLDAHEQEMVSEAEKVAERLFGKIPVIYAAGGFGGVATRFRQQVNENAKMLCWHNVIPEMNHNELVGWRIKNNDLAVLIFRNASDYDRIQTRMEINKKIISEYTETVMEVWSKGDSALQRTFYLIHLGDWISYFLAGLRGVDIMEVKVIDYLKGELAKL